MDSYVHRRKLGGEVYFSRFAYRMLDHNAPEPDVGYVCEDKLTLMEEGGMRGAPDIAVEIVAKESRERDWVTKRELYEKFGVREYWSIDYLQRKIEFLKLMRKGFVPMKLEDDHIFRSQVLPGFWLDIEWLLAKPLPSTPDCLDQILKG
jgi:Uma2 family endonuclease